MENNQSLAYLANKGPFYYSDFTLQEKNKPLSMEINNLSNSNNKLSPVYSDIEIPLHCSIKIQYVPDKYGTIAQYLAMSTFVQKVIHEPLIYNEALCSPKSVKW